METGAVQFEYDHPGYFIRGDDCFKLLVHVGTILRDAHKMSDETKEVLYRLLNQPDFALGRHLKRIQNEVIGKHIRPDE
jgi:hypothetical protein